MKNILLAICMFTSLQLQANTIKTCKQGEPDCCPNESNLIVELPTAEKLSCKDNATLVNLYHAYPKLPYYKDYRFTKVERCESNTKEASNLRLAYCIVDTTQDMKITLYDFQAPYYTTKMGQVSKKMFLFNFTLNNVYGNFAPTLIRQHDKAIVKSLRFATAGGDEDTVTYLAYHQDRWGVDITVTDKARAIKTPKQFEVFIKNYVEQLHF